VNESQESNAVNPEDWYLGKLLRRFYSKHFLEAVVPDTNGGHISVHIEERDVTVAPGNHALCQPAGSELWLRLEPNVRRGTLKSFGRFPYRALECQFIIPDGYVAGRETGRIHAWHGTHGQVIRDCGCSIFVMLNANRKPESGIDLSFCDRVEYDVIFSEMKRYYIGDHVRPVAKVEVS
jgi:hypothetical protein